MSRTITRPKRSVKRSASTSNGTPSIRTFRQANAYLDSLTNYERVARVRYNSANFGLARMNRLLSALGNPHKSYKTIHLAGTKGKGSTAAMISEMLRGCSVKVGMYTSPHVLKICERIIVDGGMISEPEFARAIGAVVAVTQRARVANPTYFEVLTAAAFHYFAMKGVEVAVVEAGMGGRLDSTNVITPEVVGITSISLDHQSQLGSRLDAIAAEKAGVIKKGVPVVSAPQAKEVRKVIEDAAMTASAPLRFSTENTDYSYRFEHSRVMGRHARICFSTARSRFEHVHVPLAGEHQATNCGLALSMLDVLKDRGVPVDDQRAMEGLANVKLLARMQIVAENPRVLCDGAHNASSVDALMRAIGQNVTYDSMVVIFGCQKDKDISGMIRRIQVGADKLIFTPIRSPRTADPNDLAALYVEHSGKMAQVADSLDDAMQSALGAVGQEDLICVTGSFYVAAEAIRKFGQEKQLQN